jgi:hypothetical protein
VANSKDAKKVYQKKYNAIPAHKKKRAKDNKARSDLGLAVGDTRDASRQPGGGFKAESRSSNRSRGGKIGDKKGKAQGGRNSSRKGVKNIA